MKASTTTLITFKGEDGEDLNEWIYQMERYFERARLHEKVKVEFASDYLLSYARYFFRQLTKDKQPTWKELTNALVMNYDSTNRQSKLKKSLREFSKALFFISNKRW